MSDLILVLLFVAALLFSIGNYIEWAGNVGDPGYFYRRQRNGWWTLFWLAVLAFCGWRLS